MQYFCLEKDRKGTCYHEFWKGRWDGMSFWRPDSLLLHDDVLTETKLYRAFQAALPSYAYYGETEIRREDWRKIVEYARCNLDKKALHALEEAETWVNGALEQEESFTLLGIWRYGRKGGGARR